MSDFITNGTAVLPPVKSDIRVQTDTVTEWGATDANEIRQALLDVRSEIINIEQAGTGAGSTTPVTANGSTTARTLGARFADVVNVLDYGAVGNGIADDTAAVNAALATGRTVYFPSGTYLATSLSPTAGSSIVGDNKLTTTIKRTSTSTFISALPAGAVIRDITLDGNAGSYASGKGVLVAAGAGRQTIDNARLRNWPSTALEFAADGGSEFKAINATFHTTGSAGTVAAVVMVPTGVDSSAVPRHFKSIESEGCTLFSFGGVNHVWASGFYTNGLLFTSASAFNIELREFRAGALGGTITVQGDSHFMSGVSAVAWIIKSTSSIYHVQAPSWNLTEQSPAANNSIEIINPTFWSMAWTATGTAPSLGNGTLSYRWSRRGAWIRVSGELTFGSTTTPGTFTWEFSLPQPAISTGLVAEACGSAIALNGAGTAGWTGTTRVAAAASVLRIYYGSGATFGAVGNNSPFTWDTGSTLRFFCEYRVT